jgi:hypothetical protein
MTGPKPNNAGGDLRTWSVGNDNHTVEPRQWLLGDLLCRRTMTVLYGDGGVGKSALLQATALSLASGRTVLGQHIFERCRVLLLSFEDDEQELRRRWLAGMRYHNIRKVDLGNRLRCSAINRSDLRLAQTEYGEHKSGKLVAALDAEIKRHGIDVVILDPFVKTHDVTENDNGAIDFVAGLLTGLAIRHNVAVMVAHHTRKGPAGPGNADSGRGASSLKDAARLVYTLTKMSWSEARNFDITEAERRSLIRLDPGKVNLTPAIKARWFRLLGVPLGNGSKTYPAGDIVQTVACWTPPDIRTAINRDIEVEILRRIERGTPNGQRYSSVNATESRAAWRVVNELAPKLSPQQCRRVIGDWIKDGKLVVRDYLDPVTRRRAKGLFGGSNLNGGTVEGPQR